MPKKITLITMSFLFVVFASLQFNDLSQYGNADAWSWVIIYITTAAITVLPLFINISKPLIAGFAGFSLGAFVFRMQDSYGNFHFEKFAGRDWLYSSDGKEMIQQTNEAGGLFIVFIWLTVLYFILPKKDSCE